MPRPAITETRISDISSNYQFEWTQHDFLVSDEQHYLRIHDTPTHVDGYIIGICTRGRARIDVNHQAYQGGAHSMIITTPHQVLRVKETSPGFRCRFIVFSKRFLTASFINPHIPDTFRFTDPAAIPVIHLEEEEASRLVSQFVYIWERFTEKDNPYVKEITGNLLMVLLHDFETLYQRHYSLVEKKPDRREELNRQFQQLLHRYVKQERGVRFYAGKLFISPKHLTETIKAATGHTAGEWISNVLALEAQSLLQSHEYSIQQVARLLGYPDQSSFGKFFKKETGYSPSDYRKGLSGKRKKRQRTP